MIFFSEKVSGDRHGSVEVRKTLLCIGKRRCPRSALPEEPVATSNATGNDKRFSTGSGVAAKHTPPSQHLCDAPIKERHTVLRGRGLVCQRPARNRNSPASSPLTRVASSALKCSKCRTSSLQGCRRRLASSLHKRQKNTVDWHLYLLKY